MASRDIADCDPRLQKLHADFIQRCKDVGLDILTYCTYRSVAEQNDLYAIGRTLPGRRVTNAKGGQSMHNATLNGKPASKAFDAVPTKHGKALWKYENAIAMMGSIGESVGLDWAGRWKGSIKESVHFQLKD
jgi:peptidoglycan L-alanyl-D-glutamate endopeptidase CwlK